jgi:GNAT superfamily N-acetyltransferase
MASRSGQNEAAAGGARAGSDDEYRIRRFEPGDRGEFCSLYESVFDDAATTEWFDWKYAENPFVDHVPIFLAERDDRIVGARPFFALGTCAGDRDVLALQPGDTMVHPEHRRQGLFSRMTERAIDVYGDHNGDHEPAFFFNFPNGQSRPGYLSMGWRLVGETPIYYRIQNPLGMCGLPIDNRVGATLQRLTRPVAAGILDTVERFASVSTADVAVERRSDVPGSALAALYRADVPDRVHARRDERFYRWRFANPRWTYTTYLARRGNDLLGSVVVGDCQGPEGSIRLLVDVLPMGTLANERQDVFASLLDTVVADSEDADVLGVHAGVPDHDVLTGYGFLSDGSFPLSRFCEATTLVVRSVGTDEWTLGERDLTDADDWLLSFVERDTA